MRLAAIAVYLLYAAAAEDHSDVICFCVSDAGIGGACDLAACDRVPEREAVAEDQLLLFFDRRRDRLIEHSSQHLPEAVLRVPVEKVLLSRLHRRERAKYQDFAVPAVKRPEGMVYSACTCIPHKLALLLLADMAGSHFVAARYPITPPNMPNIMPPITSLG